MDTRKRMAVQALLWSGYAAISLAMVSTFQPLTGSLVFVMACVGAGLWAASEGLRSLALWQGWLDRSPPALLLRLVMMPPLFAVLLQLLLFAINKAGLSLGLLQFPPAMPRSEVVHHSWS